MGEGTSPMTEPLLCHRCTRWMPESEKCGARMNEKQLGQTCFLFSDVGEEEYYRRAKTMGWASQERLF